MNISRLENILLVSAAKRGLVSQDCDPSIFTAFIPFGLLIDARYRHIAQREADLIAYGAAAACELIKIGAYMEFAAFIANTYLR